jgi:hypothetical protein
MSACCNEYGCRRKKPIKLTRSPLTGTWYVVTAYTADPMLRTPDGEPVYRASTKHALEASQQEQLTAMFRAWRAENGWRDDA